MGLLAPLHVGAYLLAALLDAPLVFSCAVLEGRGYKIFFESMAETERGMSRAEREQWIVAQATHFARHLERYAFAFPLNWFNFYDFWQGGMPTTAVEPQPAEDRP
jgi:predicted LPLAT superfamily acyltransferase